MDVSRFPLGMFRCMTWCAEKIRAGIRRCRGATTPVVSAVFDINGEVASAVADTYAIVSTASMWLDPVSCYNGLPCVQLHPDAMLRRFIVLLNKKLELLGGVT